MRLAVQKRTTLWLTAQQADWASCFHSFPLTQIQRSHTEASDMDSAHVMGLGNHCSYTKTARHLSTYHPRGKITSSFHLEKQLWPVIRRKVPLLCLRSVHHANTFENHPGQKLAVDMQKWRVELFPQQNAVILPYNSQFCIWEFPHLLRDIWNSQMNA